MPHPYALLPAATAQNQLGIIYGEVSEFQPAPASTSDPLYVVEVDYTPDFYHTVHHWSQGHGGALPQQGAACLLVKDSRERWVCVWWDGQYQAPTATGTAGGDLSGTYPNPTVAKVQGRAVSGSAPASGNGLVWTGSAWTPTAVLQAADNLSDVLDGTTGLLNLGLDRGNKSVSFSSQSSKTVTVTHTLGSAPTSVVATSQSLIGSAICHTSSFTSSDFSLTVVLNSSLTLTLDVSWVAVL